MCAQFFPKPTKPGAGGSMLAQGPAEEIPRAGPSSRSDDCVQISTHVSGAGGQIPVFAEGPIMTGLIV